MPSIYKTEEADWSVALEMHFVHSVSDFFCVYVYNEYCFDDVSLQDFMLVVLFAVQLNLMVLKHNTEFRLAPLRCVEQVIRLKNKEN